jgi:mRNA-degrading endonuclease toxin of MazEF toxin-antitoxin module
LDFKQGDVVLVRQTSDPDSSQDGGGHLALIVSSDIANNNMETLIVCHLVELNVIAESRVGAPVIPGELLGQSQDSLVLCLQILTIFKDRITERLTSMPVSIMADVQESLAFILDLNEPPSRDDDSASMLNGTLYSYHKETLS